MSDYQPLYTQQVLQNNKFKLFMNGQQILKCLHLTEYPELISWYETGTKFFQEGEIVDISLDELYALGYILTKQTDYGSKNAWNTRTTYFITKSSKMLSPEKNVPQGHTIQLDLHNSAVRLKGKNVGTQFGVSPWIKIGIVSKAGRPEKKSVEQIRQEKAMKYLHSSSPFTPLKHFDKIDLSKEIPMLVSYDHKIVCIPKLDIAPKIGMIGLSGAGNSFIKHRLIDQAYYKWGVKVACLNDKQSESYTWAKPWPEGYTIPKIGDVSYNLLNEITTPLPCVLLYPESDELNNDQVIYPNNIGFKVSLSFKELMEEYENFYKDSDMKMDKTEQSFRTFIYDENGMLKEDSPILNATSMKDINNFFESLKVVGKKGAFAYIYNNIELPDKSIAKLRRLLLTIMSHRIVDIATNTPSQWVVEHQNGRKQKLPPILACLTADIIPINQTHHIAGKKWFPFYMRKILNDIHQNQKQNKYFDDNQFETWVEIEEIIGIIGQKGGQVVDDTIDKIWREARPARLGIVYRAQEYPKLTKTMKSQWGYYFCTKMKESEAKELCKDTEIVEQWVNVLSNLKKFEVVAIPNKAYNYFVTYDINGIRRVEEKPFHGRMLPPNSQHLSSKKPIEQDNDTQNN